MKYIILFILFLPLGIKAQTIERAVFKQGVHLQANSGESIQASFGGLVNMNNSSSQESIEKGFIVGETFIDQTWNVLANEWEARSLYLDPSDNTMTQLFGNCAGVFEARNTLGSVWNNSLPSFLNTLNSLPFNEGIWIKTDTNCEILFVGEPVYQEKTPLEYTMGIHLVPVWSRVEMSPLLLSQNHPNIIRIFDQYGNTFNPSLPPFLNNLTNIISGTSIFIEFGSDSSLTY